MTPNCPRPSSLPREYEDFTSSMGRPKTGPIGPCFVAGGGEGGACLDCATGGSAVGPTAFESVRPLSCVCPSSESRPEQQFPIVALKGGGEEGELERLCSLCVFFSLVFFLWFVFLD